MPAALFFTGALLVGLVAWWIVMRRRQDSAWREFAHDLGGQFTGGGPFRPSKVEAHVGQRTVTLDTYSVPSGDSTTQYTRLRAPVPEAAGFQFVIFREGLVGKLDKALGAQDIEVGVPDFDHDFVIQSNDVAKVRSLLADARIRQLIQEQRSTRLALKGDRLDFDTQGVIKDAPRLKSMLALFSIILRQLGA
jgi:hypothetical protein